MTQLGGMSARNQKRLSVPSGKLALFITFCTACFSASPAVSQPALAGSDLHEAHVIEVNDGDTVTLRFDGKDWRTRLIGIDAPELGQGYWGRRAKRHLIEIMNRTEWTVSLETDIESRDKYDRLLAYLWTQQRELINDRMIRDGYAVRFTIPPNTRYERLLFRAEEQARQGGKGIWGHGGLKEDPAEYRRLHPRID